MSGEDLLRRNRSCHFEHLEEVTRYHLFFFYKSKCRVVKITRNKIEKFDHV